MKKRFIKWNRGMAWRVSASALFAFSVLVWGCGGQSDHKHEEGQEHSEADGHDHEGHDHEGEEHDHAAEEGHDHEAEKGAEESHGDEVMMNPAALKAANIKVEKVAAGNFREVLRTSATVETPKGGERRISATTSGIVNFQSNLTPGMAVRAGQSLFTISSKGTDRADATSAARVNLSLAQKELARAEELMKDKLISKQEYDRINADYEAAKAAASGMAVRGASGVGLSSPTAGWLVSLEVSPGSFVETGATLAIVAQDRRLVLKADVSERDRAMVSSLAGANIRVGKRMLTLNNYDFRVVSRGQGTPTSHYIPVYMEFNNPGGISSGTTVEAWLLGAVRQGVITVPKSALVEESGLFFVYVEEHPGAFRRVEVEVGESDGNRVEILHGLKVGEKVVVAGALRIKMAGMGSGIQGHSHNH